MSLNASFPYAISAAERYILAGLGPSSNVGAVTPWVVLAYFMRTAKPFAPELAVPIYNLFSTQQWGPLFLFIAPYFVIMLMSIILAVFLFLGCPFIDCCCVCNKCNCCWKQRPVTHSMKKSAKIALGVLILMTFLAALGGVGTVIYQQTTVRQVQAAPFSGLSDLNTLVTSVPSQAKVFETQAISAASNVSVYAIGQTGLLTYCTAMNVNVTNLLSYVSGLLTQFNNLIVPAKAVQLDIESIKAALSAAIAAFQTEVNLVNALSNSYVTGGLTWQTKTNYNTNANPSTLAPSLNLPNITDLVVSIQNQTNLTNSFAVMSSSVSKYNTTLWGYLNNVTGTMDTILRPLLDQYLTSGLNLIQPTLNSLSSTFNNLGTSYAQTATLADPYYVYAFWGQIGLAVLPLLSWMLLGLCVWRKHPSWVNCCLMWIPLLASAFFLLSTILYLLSATTDFVCQETFERGLVDLPFLINASTLSFAISPTQKLNVTTAMSVAQSCYKGANLYQAAQQLGADTSTYNYTTIVTNAFNNYNLSQQFINQNLASILTSPGINGSYINNQIGSYNLSSMLNLANTTYLRQANTQVNDTIYNLCTNMTTLQTTIYPLTQSDNQPVFDTLFTVTGGTPTSTDRVNIATAFYNKVTTAVNGCNDLKTNSSLLLLFGSPATIDSDVLLMNSTLNSLTGNIRTFADLVDGTLYGAITFLNKMPGTVQALLLNSQLIEP